MLVCVYSRTLLSRMAICFSFSRLPGVPTTHTLLLSCPVCLRSPYFRPVKNKIPEGSDGRGKWHIGLMTSELQCAVAGGGKGGGGGREGGRAAPVDAQALP